MGQEEKPQSWWHTMPGMLTGGAAVITAITGLLVVMHQAGWLPTSTSEAVPADVRSETQTAVSKASPSAAATEIAPAPSEVTLGRAVFTLLRTQTQGRTPDTHGLTLSVRMTNNSPYPMNFWNSNFRLLVDGVPHAPIGDLNKVLEGNSALEGDVEFSYPANTTSLVLRVLHLGETADITLQRRPAGAGR